jgi:hypothetical protein
VQIPEPGFWLELERLILETEAQSGHYLLCRTRKIPHGGRLDVTRYPEQGRGAHGMHDWWYACL